MLTPNVDKSKSGSQFLIRPQLTHTENHVDCPGCERARTEALHVITAELSFTEAATVWLDSCTLPTHSETIKARYIKPTTETSYRQYCTSLELFFGLMPLGKIDYGNLRAYQRARLTGSEPFIRYRFPHDAKPRKINGKIVPAKGKTSCPAKPKKVNQELGVLRRIMLAGGCWTGELESSYRRLVEEDEDEFTKQRALEPDEQALWLTTAASREKWNVVYWYSILGIGCTLGTNELRYQRLGDLNLHHQTIAVAGKGVKGKGRKRIIALLTAEELWAAEKLLERAHECGCTAPQHYLFPFWSRKGAMWDPTRPMSTSGVKREWQEVREKTKLLWFRQYDLRHTGGTRLAEDGWHLAQIKARMGHITDEMSEHYTHISEAAQRREYERVSTLKFPPRSERPRWAERRAMR